MLFLLATIWPYAAAAAGLGLVAGVIGEVLSARSAARPRRRGR